MQEERCAALLHGSHQLWTWNCEKSTWQSLVCGCTAAYMGLNFLLLGSGVSAPSLRDWKHSGRDDRTCKHCEHSWVAARMRSPGCTHLFACSFLLGSSLLQVLLEVKEVRGARLEPITKDVSLSCWPLLRPPRRQSVQECTEKPEEATHKETLSQSFSATVSASSGKLQESWS